MGRARRLRLGARPSALSRDVRSVQRRPERSPRSARCTRTPGGAMSRSSHIRLLMTTDTVGGVWTYSCGLASDLANAGVNVVLVTMGPRARTDERERLQRSRVRLIETDLALEWQDPEGANV